MELDIKTATLYLQSHDPILASVIEKVELETVKPVTNHFRALVEEIISQQLSTKVADVILERFVKLFPSGSFPQPKTILRLPTKTMRTAGLSLQKIVYMKTLARAIERNKLNFTTLRQMEDEAVIEQLTQIKGIGRWTAEMFLMFSLARPDVFSYGDLGLRNAMQRLYNLRKPPSPRRAKAISEPWRPHRTLACRYLWASLEITQTKEDTV